MSDEEFLASHTGLSISTKRLPNNVNANEMRKKRQTKNLPAAVDWRNKTGYVQPIKDQSCKTNGTTSVCFGCQ